MTAMIVAGQPYLRLPLAIPRPVWVRDRGWPVAEPAIQHADLIPCHPAGAALAELRDRAGNMLIRAPHCIHTAEARR